MLTAEAIGQGATSALASTPALSQSAKDAMKATDSYRSSVGFCSTGYQKELTSGKKQYEKSKEEALRKRVAIYRQIRILFST